MPTDTVITFSFVVTHTGDYGDVVVNTAEYSHSSGNGSTAATFSIETSSTHTIYLPLTMR